MRPTAIDRGALGEEVVGSLPSLESAYNTLPHLEHPITGECLGGIATSAPPSALRNPASATAAGTSTTGAISRRRDDQLISMTVSNDRQCGYDEHVLTHAIVYAK